MRLDPTEKAEKRLSHRDRILGLLRDGGSGGVPSSALTKVTWRFSARIHELRKLGHAIETRPLQGTDAVLFVLDERLYEAPEQLELGGTS